MVFSQPVNGHRSSNMNNDTSVLDTDDGEITPLTKSQLAQVIYRANINDHIRLYLSCLFL